MQPGHIVSDRPGVIRLIISHPHPGDPAGGDQAPTCQLSLIANKRDGVLRRMVPLAGGDASEDDIC